MVFSVGWHYITKIWLAADADPYHWPLFIPHQDSCTSLRFRCSQLHCCAFWQTCAGGCASIHSATVCIRYRCLLSVSPEIANGIASSLRTILIHRSSCLRDWFDLTHAYLQLVDTAPTTLNAGDLQELQAFCHLISCVSAHKHQWLTEVGVTPVKQLLVNLPFDKLHEIAGCRSQAVLLSLPTSFADLLRYPINWLVSQ